MTEKELRIWREKAKRSAEALKIRAAIIQKRHFSSHKMCAHPVIFKNVRSYWGKMQKYSDGYQMRLAWLVVDLPQWLQDYLIYHELLHADNPGRRYGVMHSKEYWMRLKKLYPLTTLAEQALDELKGMTIPDSWKRKWENPPTTIPTTPTGVKKYGADPFVAHQKFQAELAEKYGWEAQA